MIIKENVVFSNFNSRFQEKLILSINSMLLFEQMGLISMDDGFVFFSGEDFNFFNSDLGDKATARIKAARKLSYICMWNWMVKLREMRIRIPWQNCR